MTKEYHKRPHSPPGLPDKEEILEAIDEALQEAVRSGIIVDSGQRRWSNLTGRYEIVWKSKIFGH